jgi:hypothetical protein
LALVIVAARVRNVISPAFFEIEEFLRRLREKLESIVFVGASGERLLFLPDLGFN